MNLTCTFEISLLIGLGKRGTFSMKYLNISAEPGRKLEQIVKVNIQKVYFFKQSLALYLTLYFKTPCMTIIYLQIEQHKSS